MTSGHDARGESIDSSSRDEFFDYYAEASLSRTTLQRYRQIKDVILRVVARDKDAGARLDVADIGCGAGAQCFLWAEEGHSVHGIDVNARLIELARRRAADKRLEISLDVGTATALPWAAGSMNICIMPELLEHVVDWRRCLAEAARVLKRHGVLFVTTTNRWCPVQEEFNLPIYSWYPAALKRKCEYLARTTRPGLANYATYPAVNWFSFGELRSVLEPMGFQCMDRFETASVAGGRARQFVLMMLRSYSLLRGIAQVASPYTQVIAVKA